MSHLYDSELWHRFDLGHPGGEEATKSLVERSGLPKGSLILDLCCGRGNSVAFLAALGMKMRAVDREPVILLAKEKQKAIAAECWSAWQAGSGAALPFPDRLFDAVLCECSLSLLADRTAVLSEAGRVLKQGGLLLLSDVCDGAPFELDGFERLEWRYEKEALKNFVTRWIWETGSPFPDCGRGKDYFSAVYRAVLPGARAEEKMDLDMVLLEYSRQGYACAQIMVKLGLDLLGEDNPQLVRAMSGLNAGIGKSGSCCGVLSGGAAALGLFTGRGQPHEMPHEKAEEILSAYAKWFKHEYGSDRCYDIIGGDFSSSKAVCSGIMEAAYYKMLGLLEEYGLLD